MNKISLAFALVFFIALSFTGCKSTKKVGTVEAGGAKAHNEFFSPTVCSFPDSRGSARSCTTALS